MSLKQHLISLERLKPKIYWLLALITLISAAASIFIQSRAINKLMIKNLMATEVVVTKVMVDNSLISSKKSNIIPEALKKQSEVYATLKSSNPKVIEVTTEDLMGAKKNLKCKLNIKHSDGCLFIAYIKENSRLNCVCDSYNDFDN